MSIPTTTDLLRGRIRRLRASSTCDFDQRDGYLNDMRARAFGNGFSILALQTCLKIGIVAFVVANGKTVGGENVYLMNVPDYHWHAGCFGTASGNLIGYWDRNGFPAFYDGPTNGGLAPLNSRSSLGNDGILALWASRAGWDGRPEDRPGHFDDYYHAYESTAPDDYIVDERPEHAPDCIGDFIGLSQDKWSLLNDECNGNIDGFSFVFWDSSGARRTEPIVIEGDTMISPDIPTGLEGWTRYRGYEADTFSQLSDFNPNVPDGAGFSYEDLKREIDAGYPVLLFMQPFDSNSRNFAERAAMNPNIHGMLAYGYFVSDDGTQFVRYRSSWASGDNQFSQWTASNWTPQGILNLPLRGVIGYHPHPQITAASSGLNGELTLQWNGPDATLMDSTRGAMKRLHWYVIESATHPKGPFEVITSPTLEREMTLEGAACCADTRFFRVALVDPG